MAMHQPACKQCEDYGFIVDNCGVLIDCPRCSVRDEVSMAEVLGYQQVYDYVADMTGNLNKWLEPGDAHHAHALGIKLTEEVANAR